jgi:hypothetical protein
MAGSPVDVVEPVVAVLSCRFIRRSKPPEDEEVAAAERASERQQKPVESCLKGVPVAYAPEFDGSTMRAPCEQHTLQYRAGVRAASYFRVSLHARRGDSCDNQGEIILGLPLVEKRVNSPYHFISNFRCRAIPLVFQDGKEASLVELFPSGALRFHNSIGIQKEQVSATDYGVALPVIGMLE